MKKILLPVLIICLFSVTLTARATDTVTVEPVRDVSGNLVQEMYTVAESRTSLNVSGTYTVLVKPDVATLSLGVTNEDKDSNKAQSLTNTAMNAIIKRLTGMGVKKENMTTQQISIYPMYDYTEGKQALRGYQATQMISIRMTNLENVGKVLDASIKAGANQVYSVNFSLRDKTKAYNQALEKAIIDAREKAEIIAKAAGKTIKDIVSISESSSYNYLETPSPYMSNDSVASASGSNNTSTLPGMINVTANVAITYTLK